MGTSQYFFRFWGDILKNDKLFQIGDVAYLLGISRKMILDYESAGLIKPTFVDENTRYRYFDMQSIVNIRLILDLRRVDMSIKEIKRYLCNNITAEEKIAKLIEKREYIDSLIDRISIRNLKELSVSKV